MEQVIQLVGGTRVLSAFALVNRRIADGLRGRGYQVRERAETDTFVPGQRDVVIHHDYTQEFGAVRAPHEGKFVAIRTWDFGPFPPKWVERINAEYDRLWVHSQWVKGQAVASGIPARRVQVIPWGVDVSLLHPDGAAMPLPTDKRFSFLFVGSSVHRKGFDILLRAYRAAFTPADDVALVVKDNPQDVFYGGAKATDELDAFQSNPNLPTLVYLNSALDAQEMASLYRACSVGVFPYRAEGFALPIPEAMACGLPCIVPRFGACLDYTRAATSFYLQARRIQVPVAREFVYNSLGFKEWIPAVDFCEVPVEELARVMREVYELSHTHPTALGARSERGARLIRERFTWDHSLNAIERALAKLERSKTPVRMLHQRREIHHAGTQR